jgi:hypothetical protein
MLSGTVGNPKITSRRSTGSFTFMAHSNRKVIHWSFLVAELVLFAIAIASSYFAEEKMWGWFFSIAGLSFLVFLILKLVEANPAWKDIVLHEDVAGKIATNALPQGLRDYFDMQRRSDQDRRNAATQERIANAGRMLLCANSGASYLDPGIYRHWPSVESKLMAGVDFRVVLLDPYSAEKGFRNKLNVDGEQFDSKINLAGLIKLYNTYPALDVRFVRYGMHTTVFATDQVVFVDPYHVSVVNNRIENRSFCLEIEPVDPGEGVGLYRLFMGHVESLWRSGTSFEEWIEQSSEMLPEGLPALRRRQYTI